MPFDVEMPDGTIIEDVPDGTPKEVILQKWQQAPKGKGFVDQVGDLAQAGVNRLVNVAKTVVDPQTYVQAGKELSSFPPIDRNRKLTENDAKWATDIVLSSMSTNPMSRATRASITGNQAAMDVEKLIAEGVNPTIGQKIGGMVKRAEEGLTSVPVLGDIIKGAQKKSLEEFNVAAINRALGPIGKSVPKGMPAGNRAVDFAHTTIGQSYDDILSKMSGKLDANLSTSIKQSLNEAASELTEAESKRLGSIIDRHVLNKFDSKGDISGETIKEAFSRIGKLARQFGKSENPDHQIMSEALVKVKDSISSMLQRNNPKELAAALKNTDLGYANLIRVEKAAASLGAKEGVFTPAQLASAVKAADASVRKSGFARGNALMQDLSSSGQNVLSNVLPDSGTAFRLSPYLLAGGAGVAGQQGYISSETAATIAGLSMMYTRPGQATLRGAGMTIRSPVLQRILLGNAAQNR